jgi:hypothetical protein
MVATSEGQQARHKQARPLGALEATSDKPNGTLVARKLLLRPLERADDGVRRLLKS